MASKKKKRWGRRSKEAQRGRSRWDTAFAARQEGKEAAGKERKEKSERRVLPHPTAPPRSVSLDPFSFSLSAWPLLQVSDPIFGFRVYVLNKKKKKEAESPTRNRLLWDVFRCGSRSDMSTQEEQGDVADRLGDEIYYRGTGWWPSRARAVLVSWIQTLMQKIRLARAADRDMASRRPLSHGDRVEGDSSDRDGSSKHDRQDSAVDAEPRGGDLHLPAWAPLPAESDPSVARPLCDQDPFADDDDRARKSDRRGPLICAKGWRPGRRHPSVADVAVNPASISDDECDEDSMDDADGQRSPLLASSKRRRRSDTKKLRRELDPKAAYRQKRRAEIQHAIRACGLD